jgi:acyl-coenzyme A thioesterase PaaI-like protein
LPKLTALNAGHRDELSRSPHQSDYYGGIVAQHACLAAKLSRRARTMGVRVDYLRWTVDPDLAANARVLRTGASVGTVDVNLRDSADRVIATGRRVFGTREN